MGCYGSTLRKQIPPAEAHGSPKSCSWLWDGLGFAAPARIIFWRVELFYSVKFTLIFFRPKFLSSFTNSFLLFDTWTENFFITSINDESHKIAKYKLDLPTACIKTRDISCVGIEQSNVLIGRRSHLFLFDIKSGEFKRRINLGNIDFVQSATGCRAGIVIRYGLSQKRNTVVKTFNNF